MTNKLQKEEPQWGKSLQSVLPASTLELGMVLAIGAAGPTYLGFYVDGKRGTEPFWTVCGAVFGFVFCIYQVWRVVAMEPKEEGKGNSKLETGNSDSDVTMDKH